MTGTEQPGLSPLKRALVALEAMQDRLDEIEAARNEPIAVVGAGCRLPGGVDSPESYWCLLRDGVDAVTEVPPDRWNAEAYYDPDPDAPGKISNRHGAFLTDVYAFDPQHFGISPREAASMDPQQRILLEVVWEALERAGQAPDRLVGRRAGVFLGICRGDYEALQLQSGDPDRLDLYFASGQAHSVAAGRISYVLGLQGPSVAVDTACSSSLVALHLATESLRRGECDLALAASANVILTPENSVTFAKARMLAPDGRCKTFDSRADGFVEGEGFVALVLKRLSDARAQSDPILALLRGSAVNQDGASAGLTAPNGPAQQAVIREALASARIPPSRVSYVEAHGTGTELGDPIEVQALGAVLGENRPASRPLAIGSVKTNLGHLEASAGLAGVLKVALALQQEKIPPHLHLRERNPLIPWDSLPIVIPTDLTPWEAEEGPRVAGVSSFGFSGTNAHVVLEEAPKPSPPDPVERERSLHVLPLSARNGVALRALAERYARHLAELPSPALADVCFSAATGRAGLGHRLAVRASTVDEVVLALSAVAASRPPRGTHLGAVGGPKPLKVGFLFTGQGSQYAGMGRELYETQPTFRGELERCGEVLRDRLEAPLLEVLFGGSRDLLDETEYTQPALFALEWSLGALWRSWGVEPTWVMGHSVGEYVAACVAGVFTLEEGLGLIAARGRLMGALPREGAMFSFLASEERVREALADVGDEVSVAAVNGPQSVVISGRRGAVERVAEDLSGSGVKTKRLQVSQAFHSALVDPMLEEFGEEAGRVEYRAPRLGVVSNLTGTFVGEGEIDAGYWVRHARETVRFRAGMEALAGRGCGVFVEVGPSPVLLGMGRECVSEASESGAWLPTLRPGRGDWEQVLESVGELWVRGVEVDWSGFDRDYPRRKVTLPTYPFQRERCWHPALDAAGASRSLPVAPARHPTDDWLYATEWRPADAPGRATGPPLEPSRVAARAAEAMGSLADECGLADYDTLLPQLEDLCGAYFTKALAELGWQPSPGERVTARALSERLGVGPAHLRLMTRMLEVLGEEGFLERTGDEWEVRQPPPPVDTEGRLADLLERFPASQAELQVAGRCGESFARVLHGEVDALQLLFPDGSFDLAERLYQEAPAARAFGGLLRESVAAVVADLPAGHRLRVLEIGAGTGAATRHVLEALPPERTEYVFTDVSRTFTVYASEKFRGRDLLRYDVLDIETPPEPQGFSPRTFDIVLAANVLHATRDLAETLSHVRELVRPGGLVLFLETVQPQRFCDVSVGLTEGWWRFEDTDLRPSYALLSREQWRALLLDAGFEDVATVPGDAASSGVTSYQSVIMARAPVSATTTERPGHWIVFTDAGGVGEALAVELEARGNRCTRVRPGTEYHEKEAGQVVLNPSRREDVDRVLASDGDTRAGVVHLWALDLDGDDEQTTDALATRQARLGQSALHLIQGLASAPSPAPGLTLVTRGAQAVGRTSHSVSADQATLWGLGKVAALEHPELRCLRLDLDPERPGREVGLLVAEILSEEAEDQVAFRDGERLVARLARVTPGPEADRGVVLREDVSYLVTGGLSGLGLLVARWCVERGARHLLLVARSTPSPQALEAVREMEASGATVVTARGDVSRAEQVRGILDDARRVLPPLKGVIHSAGVLDDGVILQQSWDRFERVLAPKVLGAWNLHQATRAMDLEHFVLFSSGAALLGSPGQANHAAANAFLDALAHGRRADGLPALSINWGAWAGVGAAAGGTLRERLTLQGMDALTPEEGLAALGRVLNDERAQVGVLAIDWERLSPRLPAGSTFFAEMRASGPSGEAAAPPETRGLRASLEGIAPSKRRGVLEQRVRQEAVRVLGLPPGRHLDRDRPLQEMGLDSLMAVELRNALSRAVQSPLPATLLFDHPTVERLVGFLGRDTLGLELAARQEEAYGPPGDPEEDELDALSTDEMAALLSAKLDGLDKGGSYE